VIDYRLYLATDRGYLGKRDLSGFVREAVEAGVTLVQLREKDCSGATFYSTAVALRRLTRELGIGLIVNDRVDIALACEADGIHVGRQDLPLPRVRGLVGPSCTVGYSVHTPADLAYAEANGADYVGVGPVFPTGTKTDAEAPLGLDGLQRIVSQAAVPCVAIGGSGLENAASVYRTGVAGVCVISAVWCAPDPWSACRALRDAALPQSS
jgi:thiamine-phosphate pyrophosphorylase